MSKKQVKLCTVYHATANINMESIGRKGLQPHSPCNWPGNTIPGYLYFTRTPKQAVRWISYQWAMEMDVYGDVKLFDDIAVLKVMVPCNWLEPDIGSDMRTEHPVSPEMISVHQVVDGEFVMDMAEKELEKYRKCQGDGAMWNFRGKCGKTRSKK